MTSDNDDHIETEPGTTTSQVSTQSDNKGNGYTDSLPQGESVLHQHVSGDAAVQTQGGAYIDGDVKNEGGVNVLGGKVDTINYYQMSPSLPASSKRPENHFGAPRNPLFQPRPGEFEELERLLFEVGTGPKQLGLVGMGGIGKTELAIQLAYRYEERFPEGVFRLIATGTTLADWQHHLAELAFNTNYLPPDDDPSRSENEARRARHFCRYLAEHRNALLILDNVDDPGLLISVLPALAGGEITCSLLYTSRVTRVPPGITVYSVDKLPQEAALRLLLASTRPIVLAEILQGRQSEETQAAQSMCDIVGYLPLALEHLRSLLDNDQYLLLTTLLVALREQGALEVANDLDPDAASLIATFRLSWEKVKEVEAQQLFKLAAYFPEAAPIPLWLLGLAAGLGEKIEGFTPLGRMWIRLHQLSLLEKLSKDQVRLHPLVREFGHRLVAEDSDKGQTLLREAAERLASEFTSVNKLEQRARNRGYWGCLEQVRAVRQYIKLLGATDQAEQVKQIRRWLDRESYLLGDGQWWPKAIPGLFYQQLFNRSAEEDHTLNAEQAPAQWVRQMKSVGTEDRWLLRTFVSRAGGVRSVAFSLDGNQVLIGSTSGIVQLWEATSGRIIRQWETGSGMLRLREMDKWDPMIPLMRLYTGGVSSVAFSSNGSQVLTGSNDGTVRLWEAARGKLLITLGGHMGVVSGVAFSPDGSLLLTGSLDGTARLWETASGKTMVILQNLKSEARLWDIVNSKPRATPDGLVNGVSSVAFSPDGSQVLTGSEDGTARFWEVASGKLLNTLRGHTDQTTIPAEDQLSSVAFSPDGSQVLTGSWDKTAQLWEVGSGKLLATLTGHGDVVNSVAFSPDNTLLLTGSWDTTARLWETASGKLLAILQGHINRVNSVAFSPDGSQVLTGSDDGTARLWKVAHLKMVGTLRNLNEGNLTRGIISMAFSPDGQELMGLTGGIVQLWDVASGKLLSASTDPISGVMMSAFPDYINVVNNVAFSPDGNQMLTGFYYGTAKLWETGSGKLLTTLRGYSEQSFTADFIESLTNLGLVMSVAFSSDGRQVFTGSANGIAWLWETDSGKLLATLQGSTSAVGSVAFSPDGQQVLTGLADGTAQLWETASGRLLATLQDSTRGVISIAFSPDGQQVLTGLADGTARLWQVNSCKLLAILQGHTGLVTGVTFSPTGDLMLTCDSLGWIFFWRATGAEIGRLVGVYVANYEIGAIYWKDTNHIVLADSGGSQGRPHFYRLQLQGMP